jgi:mono/diheme cytochrome c family protein
MRRAGRLTRAFAAAAAGLALLGGAGCTARGDRPAPAAPGEQTRRLYERSCAVCHGPSGEGKQLGTMRVPTLREGQAAAGTDERLFAQISDGGNGMPPFKHTLDDRQIQDLVRFVREELQGKK